jgi:hypothetical protein
MRSGHWSAAAGRRGALWATHYEGPPHVVFGHSRTSTEPQLHPWATGIDTGCVYGGQASRRVVLDEGEPMPHGDAALSRLRSVQAVRRYYGAKGVPLEK